MEVLYQTDTHPRRRITRDGQKIAFEQHKFDGRGMRYVGAEFTVDELRRVLFPLLIPEEV